MDFSRLKPFIESSAKSSNPKIKQAADSLTDQVIAAQQSEEIAQPTLHAQSQNKPLNQKPKDEVDQQMNEWMSDISEPEPDASNFGKIAASYCSDVIISSLPKPTQEDILKFVPSSSKGNMVVQYGMVVDELRPKVDHHNWETAYSNVKKDYKTKGKKSLADKFQDKVDKKYILILNDTIVDGHHFLAMASILGISCSLKVLDLTPIRFQQKTAASLFDYVQLHYYNRQAAA